MKENELKFEDLLLEIKESGVDNVEVGNFRFTELTMSEKRKTTSISVDPIEIPIQMNNLYNEFIKNHVSNIDYTSDIGKEIGVDLKPYLLVKLRDITLGNKFVEDNVEYSFKSVTKNDLSKTIEPELITFKKFIIRISVPSLDKDSFYNTQLASALQEFKNKKQKNEDLAKIMDIINVYELMKYINEIEMNEKVLEFSGIPLNKKMKIIDALPFKVIQKIEKYIEKVNDNAKDALTAVSSDNKEYYVDSTFLFLPNFAKID